ncbi:MAG: dihydrodipicolinate synthase family protein [Armatimonadota bacterium]|nr:dihydrodipicolinate synthase family protein [Armatimonadota bacterium]
MSLHEHPDAHRSCDVTAGTLPKGIVPVLQTPFAQDGSIDLEGLERLTEDAVRAGARGVLAPAVASEVDYLARAERRRLVSIIARSLAGRLPFIVGASSNHVEECVEVARLAEQVGAAAYLVAVPDALYRSPEDIPGFFQAIASKAGLPLIIQDLEWSGPGLPLEVLRTLKAAIPTLAGIKIETVPAGPKYTAVREAFGEAFYICGGWAVPQMIEALDRGVDAMIPEASMVRVYAAIYRLYHAGNRGKAQEVFRELLPVLAFANQEIRLSIAFFKALLVRKGIFRYETMRWPGFRWDAYHRRIADELIEHYLALEERVGRLSLPT